jgi:8-amino-7-oxononanoate synthase
VKPRWGFIEAFLEERRSADRLRQLPSGGPDGLTDVASNDYLGMRRRPALTEAAIAAVKDHGAGSGASRLLGGTTPLHAELERMLAAYSGREAALLFNSGYQLNTSLLPALASRDTRVYMDRLNHNSLYQGAVASRAVFRRYHHADLAHLESLLKADEGDDIRRIIVSEAVFSMDGDVAPIDGLVALAEAYDAILIIDEAHSIGLFGEQGRGLCHGRERIDIVIGTFGKAFGTFGAYAACSARIRDYLVNACGGFIYTTALPPAVVGATIGALRILPYLKAERELVFGYADALRSALVARGFDTRGSASPIVPAVIGSDGAALAASRTLKEAGFQAHAVRPPTVEEGTARIRFTVSAAHTREQMDRLIEAVGRL